jgi:voltage-gated potassium channel
MSTVRDHYVVVGFNQLGQAVVHELRSAGAPVCVIDKDETKEALAAAHGLPFVLGDGSSNDILTMAGVEHAKGVAVTMTDLGDAILVTLSARQLAPKVVIATRVADPTAASKARKAGADHIVSPNAMGGWRMAHSLVRPHTMNLLDVATLSRTDDLLLDEFELSPSSPFVGRSLADLEVRTRYGASIVALRRVSGELLVTPRAEDTLQGGDVIIAIGKPTGVRELVAASKEQQGA